MRVCFLSNKTRISGKSREMFLTDLHTNPTVTGVKHLHWELDNLHHSCARKKTQQICFSEHPLPKCDIERQWWEKVWVIQNVSTSDYTKPFNNHPGPRSEKRDQGCVIQSAKYTFSNVLIDKYCFSSSTLELQQFFPSCRKQPFISW